MRKDCFRNELMDNKAVSITACENYDKKTVREALLKVLQPLHGLDWVKPGMKIAIKTNLVSAMKPQEAATTHPTLVAEICRLLVEAGADVVVGDSPGGVYTVAYVNHVYAVSGMKAIEETGAKLNRDFGQTSVTVLGGTVLKAMEYTSYLQNVDAIINVCKLKTHGMMGMSAATKNMFGAIPGTRKPEYHFLFPEAEAFAGMLIDLNEFFRPALCIVDAVEGMEGNGPTKGTPRHIGALAVSTSPYALDFLCASLIGLTPQDVPTLLVAQKRGLLVSNIDELIIYGDPTQFVVKNFEKLTSRRDLTFQSDGKNPFGILFGKVAKKALQSHPAPQKDECIGCKKCAEICPAKAISMVENVPQIDKNKCICCFCCQEFCPKGAMKVRRTWIARLMSHK